MYLNAVNALVGLLAFSHTLWVAQAYPAHHATLSAATVSALENDSKSIYNNSPALLSKRTSPMLPLNWGQYPGTTWSGHVKEPANSGWTTSMIDEYAKAAWEDAKKSWPREATIVAALWIRGTGVYLGSIPHGRSDNFEAQVLMDGSIKNQAPVLWENVRNRAILKGRTKWHAEDMAMYTYEKEEHPQGPRYPDNSYMAVYGQYNKNNEPGPKPPCGVYGTANISYPCANTLRALGITASGLNPT